LFLNGEIMKISNPLIILALLFVRLSGMEICEDKNDNVSSQPTINKVEKFQSLSAIASEFLAKKLWRILD